MKRLKIFVFDDSPIHRRSAQLTLGRDHELTVVSNYDRAQDALAPRVDGDRQLNIFADKFGDREPFRSTGLSENQRKERIEYYCGDAEKGAVVRPDFDVVLTDLLVLPSAQQQGPEGSRLLRTQMPLGAIIALLALAGGVKKVAVVTDTNHHNHPASAAFDCFGILNKCGNNIICTNRVNMVPLDEATNDLVDINFLYDEEGRDTEEGLIRYPFPKGQTWGKRKGLSMGKNWADVLDALFGADEEAV